MSLFPIFLKLRGRVVVVVGGGAVAESKIPGLFAAGATVRVVAPEVTETIARWALDRRIELRAKPFESGDLAGAFLAIAATSSPGVNEGVFREAEARQILCNAVDDPQRCHFYYPAVVQRGPLQIAISTNGLSPALAMRLRTELEAQFGPEYEMWLEWLGTARKLLRAGESDPEANKKILHMLASREMFEQFLRETHSGRTLGSVA
ncbi:MAG: bifunctional precorrin-2 dehydrogenase/sirohydrochlorin ferrochelatase [Candidatus Acidiferrales bacterium]